MVDVLLTSRNSLMLYKVMACSSLEGGWWMVVKRNRGINFSFFISFSSHILTGESVEKKLEYEKRM